MKTSNPVANGRRAIGAFPGLPRLRRAALLAPGQAPVARVLADAERDLALAGVHPDDARGHLVADLVAVFDALAFKVHLAHVDQPLDPVLAPPDRAAGGHLQALPVHLLAD